jgi:rhodanese-related sulfurtransferase
MLIGLLGHAGSGKSTVAGMLEDLDFAVESFAKPLKDCVSATFGWDRTLLEGETPEARAWRERVDPWWAERLGEPGLTPRWALQRVGTEAMRAGLHEDVWIASLQRRLKGREGSVVVSDVRMPNEAAAVRAAGGKLVRIVRPGAPCTVTAHVTESALDELAADVNLINDGTLEELREQLAGVLKIQQEGPIM